MSQEPDIITTTESNEQSVETSQVARASPFQSLNRNELEGAGDGPFAKLIAPEGARGLFLISFVDLEVNFRLSIIWLFNLFHREISKAEYELEIHLLHACMTRKEGPGLLLLMALHASQLNLISGQRIASSCKI